MNVNADTSLNLYRIIDPLREPFNSWLRWQEGPDEQKEGGYHSKLQPQSMRFDLQRPRLWRFCLWNADSPAVKGYTPYYFTVGLTLSHKSEKWWRRNHQVMEILDLAYPDQVQILLTQTNCTHTHNLYHYQIIVKYRFERRHDSGLESNLRIYTRKRQPRSTCQY